MNGGQEMVNKYHKKSPQHLTDDMGERGERIQGESEFNVEL